MSRDLVDGVATGNWGAIHIIPGLDRKDGGPSYSVPRLCDALRAAGCAASILTVEADERRSQPHVVGFKQEWMRPGFMRMLRVSRGLRRAANGYARGGDILHVHGLWLMPNVYAGVAAAKHGTPLIVSPRGMLSPAALTFSALRKKVFWSLLQGPAYAKAAAWHATSTEEAADIRAFGITAPIAIIPNGIDVPQAQAQHDETKLRRTLLFLSRLHEKKGLPVLIKAWAKVAPQRPYWDLVIAGPDERGHRSVIEALVNAERISSVRFLGPVYGKAKEALLRESDLFVLPTKSENFGLVVAEALAAGVPAIVSTGAPWAGLEGERCGWWIGQGVEPLVDTLLDATAADVHERRAMGVRGRAWMARDFGWTAIGNQMFDLYRSLERRKYPASA